MNIESTVSTAMRACACLVACLFVFFAPAAMSQTFPSKPVRIIVPVAAGGGVDTIAHLVGEVFRLETGIEVIHIPYKGDANVIPALLAGEVHYAFLPQSAIMPQARAGKLRALGVTGRVRSPQLPELPTLIESGVPNFDFETWVGVFATGGTPVEVQARISAEVARVLRLPDIIERLPSWGGQAVGNSPEAFSARYRADIARYGKVVREAKVPTLD